jgi:hypothetical protein
MRMLRHPFFPNIAPQVIWSFLRGHELPPWSA